jgi:hypothetical protein
MADPRLQALRKRSRDLHPTMSDNQELSHDLDVSTYTPGLQLPAHNDKLGMLKYLGLNDSMAQTILERLHQPYPKDHDP